MYESDPYMDCAPAYSSVDTEYSKPISVKRLRKHVDIDREIDKEQRKINNNNNDSPTAQNNKQQHIRLHHNNNRNRYPVDNTTATIARRRSPSAAGVPTEYRQHQQGVTAVKMADDAMMEEQERVRVEQEKAERRAAKRNCCMKMLKFLFSNIGLSAMVVLYTVAGGFIFEHLEKVTWSVHFV